MGHFLCDGVQGIERLFTHPRHFPSQVPIKKENEVQEAMKDINLRKSAGWDKMPPGIFKVGAEALAPSIKRFYDECIRQMVCPHDWKKGQWTP